jgi:hypothetical protein
MWARNNWPWRFWWAITIKKQWHWIVDQPQRFSIQHISTTRKTLATM